MSEFEIRALTVGDHAGVLALAHRLSEHVAPWRCNTQVLETVQRWVHDAVTAHNPDRAPVVVAVAADRVLGFAVAGTRTHWTGDVDGYLGELVVDPSAESAGVGRALVAAVEHWCRSNGYGRVTLETGAANTRARRFYDHLGYQTEEVVLTRSIVTP